MKRLVTLTATAVLSVLTVLPGTAAAAPRPATGAGSPILVPPVIIWNQQPVFDDYLACVGGFVYTDFVDPDGDDSLLAVQMAVYRPSMGHWTYHPMTNTGPSVHGVFFWSELATAGITPASVTRYAFRATDQVGLRSSWVYADGDCTLA